MSNGIDRVASLSAQEKRAWLAQLLQKQLSATQTVCPLSYGQQSMWFMYQLAPDNAAYNVAFSARVLCEVDAAALKRVCQKLLDRHAGLRTTFALQADRLVQIIPGYREVAFEQVDASACNEAELRANVTQAAERPFDLENGPVFRVSLFTRDRADHVLLIAAHHIVLDGWSMGVLLDEFRILYAAARTGSLAALPDLKAQYKDFVAWQTEMLAGSEGERHWRYWQQQLAGEPPVLNLPTDRPRPPKQTFNGATHSLVLGDELSQKIKELSRTHQTTPFTVLLAAFQVLIHRYTGQSDVWVGSPTAGRSRAEFAGIVGDFINMNVLRGDLAENPSFTAFLGQMRQTVHAAIDHQDYPFLLLVEKLVSHHDASRSPLFQVAFDLQRLVRSNELAQLFTAGNSDTRVDVAGLILTPYPVAQQEGQFDLTLQLAEVDGALLGAFKYNVDLFDAATIARLQMHYQMLLEGITANPDQRLDDLPILTDDERRRLVIDWNDTARDYPRDRCVHQLFEDRAERTPEAIAVTGDSVRSGREESITYRELDRRANQVAHYLIKLGVRPDVIVGISIDRTVEMLIGLLGILKAGGAYLPLDPAFPQERLKFMIDDAQVPVLVTQQRLLSELPKHTAQMVCLDRDWDIIAAEDDEQPAYQVTADHLAYLLYTSGSAGKPKGVMIPHQALTNFLWSMHDEPGLTERDTVLAITTLSFDIAGLELYLPLITGAHVVIASREVASDGTLLFEKLNECNATVMQATPATWRMLIDSGWIRSPGLKMLCGGEALPHNLANQMLSRGGALWNMYGPTETTIWSSTGEVRLGDDAIGIGHPIANTQFYVLDARLQPVPIGVAGELYIGGDGVARGYWHRSDLTTERFLDDPFIAGSRMYKTGDLVRYRNDGSIEFVGRADFQVKVRGFRIELGEIELALQQHPAVRQVVVVAHEDRPGNNRLIGYIVPREVAPTANSLRTFLKDRLPDYMVPTLFVMLDRLPLTPNGKLDRHALPKPDSVGSNSDDGYVAPGTQLERLIADVWREVLAIDQIGARANFFELGGHSLSAAQAIARLRDKLQIAVPLRSMFDAPTVAELAQHLDAMMQEVQRQQIKEDRLPGEREEIDL